MNHAGEYGAVRIYKGQISGCGMSSKVSAFYTKHSVDAEQIFGLGSGYLLCKFRNDAIYPKYDVFLLHEMLQGEERHLAYFESQIKAHHSRPTIFLPLWHFGGYMMGKISAILSPKTAMLCTEAVEEVIDEHYMSQKQVLHDIGEHDLAGKVEQFRLEELEHKNIAIEYGSRDAPIYGMVKGMISIVCKVAIWMSKAV